MMAEPRPRPTTRELLALKDHTREEHSRGLQVAGEESMRKEVGLARLLERV